MFAVPLRRSERPFGLIRLFGTTPDVSQKTCDALRVMSIMLYEKARRIVPRLGVFVQFGGLTLRETDCLRLVARDLSDQAIGKQLKISGSTVHDISSAPNNGWGRPRAPRSQH